MIYHQQHIAPDAKLDVTGNVLVDTRIRVGQNMNPSSPQVANWVANAIKVQAYSSGDTFMGVFASAGKTAQTVYTHGTRKPAFVGINGGDSVFHIYDYSSQGMLFGTNGADRMRILSNGNIGIGNPSPAFD